MVNIDENAQKAWIRLVELARSRKTCTYKEIGAIIGVHYRQVGRVLDPIYDYCREENLPPLTILVVRADDGLPGSGFPEIELEKKKEKKVEAFNYKKEDVFNYNWDLIRNPYEVDYCSFEQVEDELQEKIAQAEVLSNGELKKRLSKSDPKPITATITNKVFIRNQYVIVAVLRRAKGICENCKKPAPFIKDKDNTPYLEVHHNIPLAVGGDDSVENATALCPNCHRHVHHGKNSY